MSEHPQRACFDEADHNETIQAGLINGLSPDEQRQAGLFFPWMLPSSTGDSSYSTIAESSYLDESSLVRPIEGLEDEYEKRAVIFSLHSRPPSDLAALILPTKRTRHANGNVGHNHALGSSEDAAGDLPRKCRAPASAAVVPMNNQRSSQPKLRKYSSIYTGVNWAKNSLKWKAGIRINGKNTHLGYFDSEEAAALKYDQMAVFFGRSTNFAPASLSEKVGYPVRAVSFP